MHTEASLHELAGRWDVLLDRMVLHPNIGPLMPQAAIKRHLWGAHWAVREALPPRESLISRVGQESIRMFGALAQQGTEKGESGHKVFAKRPYSLTAKTANVLSGMAAKMDRAHSIAFEAILDDQRTLASVG